MSRAKFLAAPVADLAVIRENGDVVCAPQPRGTSEKAYREHLASGPRMTVYVRGADTRDLPPNLWGGSRALHCDPYSAGVIARSALGKGQIVSTTWETGGAR